MPPCLSWLLDLPRWRWVPLPLVLLLNGCGYYGQLLSGQVDLLARREPISELLAQPDLDPQLRKRLVLAEDARAFASRELALPDNQSYRLYADLGRPYVVWNLFATAEFSLEPQTHCFPIAGCVAYRGFYEQNRARGAAALLKQEGLDTYVAGIEAYSTLGWFADPLLNTMLRWDDQRWVAVIFHELAHQQFYLPGDTAFNESYASFVETEGLRQWRRARDLHAPENGMRERQREQFSALVLASRERLQALYASGKTAQQMRAGKAAEFDRLRAEYQVLRTRQWAGDGRYDAWIYSPLNNAKLLPFGLYDQWQPAFAALFREQQGDWPRFYAAVKTLGQLPESARQTRLAQLQREQTEAAN
ncbi:putative aminopeptidase [Pseudomonas sp. TE3786]